MSFFNFFMKNKDILLDISNMLIGLSIGIILIALLIRLGVIVI